MLFRSPDNSNEKQGGFTPVEVQTAFNILSGGMPGTAGLHLHSTEAGRTSFTRYHAVTVADDGADRLRANLRDGSTFTLAGADNNNAAASTIAWTGVARRKQG